MIKEYENLSYEEYGFLTGIRSSEIKWMLDGSEMYAWKKFGTSEDTKALKEGRAIHKALLEPETFNDEFCFLPETAPRRPSTRQRQAKNPSAATIQAIDFWYKYESENYGKTSIDKESQAAVQHAMALQAKPDSETLKHILNDTKKEVSFTAKVEGLPVKCRVDMMYLDDKDVLGVYELKTINALSIANAKSEIRKYHYVEQLAFYSQIIHQKYKKIQFYFLFFEKKPPHRLRLYEIESCDVWDKIDRVNDALHEIHNRTQTGVYIESLAPIKLMLSSGWDIMPTMPIESFNDET